MASPAARLSGPQPAAEAIPLTVRPRVIPCDATASGAEDAQVGLRLGPLALFFCAHHYREFEIVLVASGWRVVIDNRGALR
jgi:hypothetical protein